MVRRRMDVATQSRDSKSSDDSSARARQSPRQSRVRESARLSAAPIAVFIISVSTWEALSAFEVLNPVIVPAPSDVFTSLLDLARQRFFWDAVYATLTETLLGFFVGAVGGFAIGALTATFVGFRRAIYPYVIAFQNLPRIALAPVFLTWFGFGLASKVVMAATIAFFPLVINTVVGLDSVDRDARLMMRSLGASSRQMFWKLTLPSSAPVVFAGIKQAMTLALLGAIVAEFVGGSRGLGVLVKTFNFQLDVSRAFAVLLVLGIIGLVLYALVAAIDRKLIFWREPTQ